MTDVLRRRLGSGTLRYRFERSVLRGSRICRSPYPGTEVRERIATWLAHPPRDVALSVCIPTRERLDLLLPCLDSLARTCTAQPIELLLCDTGSSAATHEIYAELGITPLELPQPFNFSRACNAMAARARGSKLLFLNNDTEARTPDWVTRVLQDENQITGAALVYPHTDRVQHGGMTAVRLSGLQLSALPPPHRRRSVSIGITNIGLGAHLARMAARATVMAVTGAFLCIDRDLFEAVNGFDEAFTVDLQDVDLCLRARARGVPVVCRRDIVFTHRHAGSRGRYSFPLRDWQLFVRRWQPELERWAECYSAAAPAPSP